jgi:hypothetical protein
MDTMRNQFAQRLAEIAFSYIGDNPEENLPKLLKWADTIDAKDDYKFVRECLCTILEHPKCNWYRFLIGLWDNVDPAMLKIQFTNLFQIVGQTNQKDFATESVDTLPWARLNSIIEEGNFLYSYCCGETFVRKDDLIRECETFADNQFLLSVG